MTEKEIREHLGVTVAGLSVLAGAAMDSHGRGRGPGINGPRVELRRGGMLQEQDFGPDTITPTGRDLVAQARELAWHNLLGEGIEQ